MNDFTKLLAFRKAYKLAMEIFELSKSFPKEEKYSLTDQVRRSSRSVCTNTAEAYRKRRYVKHYVSKMTDSDAENSETQVWLAFAFSCKYISKEKYDDLYEKSLEVGRLIAHMISHPEKYGVS